MGERLTIKYPVLIGSRALKYYGIKYTNNKSDYDIIVSPSDAYKLVRAADRKISDKIIQYGDKIIELHVYESGDTNNIIYNMYNNDDNHDNDIITVINFSIDFTLKIKIPSLYTLYVIKKSHIHRILDITGSLDNNVDIWRRHMHMYTDIRNKLANYIGGDYTLIDNLCQKHFDFNQLLHKRIQEVNDRVGDAVNIENSKLDSFFKDNVPRVIDHDVLHEKVASIFDKNWEDGGLLFKKFISTSNEVSMDQTLFMNADKETRNMVIIQEIIVLLLERKILPSVKSNLKFVSINDVDKYYNERDLYQIIAHYITNLAGSDWLRNYCLDHWNIFSIVELYDKNDIWSILVDVLNINATLINKNGTPMNMLDVYKLNKKNVSTNLNPKSMTFIKEYGVHRLATNDEINIDKSLCVRENYYKISNLSLKESIKNKYTYSYVKILDLNASTLLEIGSKIKYKYLFELKCSSICSTNKEIILNIDLKLYLPSINKELLSYVIQPSYEYLIIHDVDHLKNKKYLLYSYNSSNGIIINDQKVTFFAIKYKINGSDKIDIHTCVSDDSKNVSINNDSYTIKQHKTYYRSYGCEFKGINNSGQYLQSYGRIDDVLLSVLCEYIAKICMNHFTDYGYSDDEEDEDEDDDDEDYCR